MLIMDTPDILKQIMEKRKERLAIEKMERPLTHIRQEIAALPSPPSFRRAMEKKGLSIIGEIKKASPSKGLIREEFNPVELAAQYEGNVEALSVLTEKDFFKGHPGYLAAVHERTALPLLRKDFILDSYQIYEARVLGASCVLLIVAVLDDARLEEFLGVAHALAMDALVEVHDEEEMTRAVQSGSRIIGINNRNLRTFGVDLGTTVRLSGMAPEGKLLVSESGIQTGNDVKALGRRIDGILAGEAFMRAGCISEKAREFKEAYDS